jgi:inner membrane transporter RhtA
MEQAQVQPASGRSTLLAMAALLGSLLCFLFGASFAKSLFPVVGAEGTTTLRQIFAALLLLLVMRPWRKPLSRRGRPALLAYGVALGFMNLCFYMSLRTVPLGIAIALEFTGPMLLAISSMRRPVDFLWIVFAILGLLLLLPLRTSTHNIDPTGALLALFAGAFWALYIVFGKRAGAEHGRQTVAYGTLIAALVAAPFGVLHAGARLLDPALFPIALAIGALSSAIPYSLEMIALTRIPARAYSTFISVDPALAAIVGMIMLHETLTPLQWLGVVAVVIAAAGTAATIKPAQAIAPNEGVP